MKRALIDENCCNSNSSATTYIEVLRLVILNAIEQWDPRWFYVVLVQLTCHSLTWHHDTDNNNNQEIAHRAAQWMTGLVPGMTTRIDTATTGPTQHQTIFCHLYDCTHRYIAHTEQDTEGLYNDYKYETHGAVVSCFWYPDVGARIDHIMLQFEDGVKLKIVAECRKWNDNAWFGFLEGEQQYGRRYQEMLVGKRIQSIRQVTGGTHYRCLEDQEDDKKQRGLLGQCRSVERAIYMLQTTEGWQFPFTRCTQHISWPDGWVTLKWKFPSRFTCVPVKPPRLCIVTGTRQADIVAYLNGDQHDYQSSSDRTNHVFLYDGDDTTRHYALCPWTSDAYFINFVRDRIERGETICFASSLFVVHGWRPFQAFMERIRDRLGLVVSRSVHVIVVVNHYNGNSDDNDHVTHANDFKKKFDVSFSSPIQVVDIITGDMKLASMMRCTQ